MSQDCGFTKYKIQFAQCIWPFSLLTMVILVFLGHEVFWASEHSNIMFCLVCIFFYECKTSYQKSFKVLPQEVAWKVLSGVEQRNFNVIPKQMQEFCQVVYVLQPHNVAVCNMMLQSAKQCRSQPSVTQMVLESLLM